MGATANILPNKFNSLTLVHNVPNTVASGYLTSVLLLLYIFFRVASVENNIAIWQFLV
jgi:hypothetical protein